MGAAARTDPTRVRVADLAETRNDPFAREIRKLLRKKHDIDCSRPIGVTAVYSEEAPLAPLDLAYDHDGFACVCPGGDNGKNDCDHRNRVEGSTAFVPAVFGMTIAATAVKLLSEAEQRAARSAAPATPHEAEHAEAEQAEA
jgi:tRNA A37 threonylcarbamoyladenosine dehydratase